MKKIKTKKINQNINQTKSFYQKVFLLTLIFLTGSIILNSDRLKFTADIVNMKKGILEEKQIAANLENIKDDSTVRPLKKVTHRGKAEDYRATKHTKWENLDENLKTGFPQSVSEIIKKYRYLNIQDVWTHISNPSERKKVIFYKRLITAIWTAGKDMAHRWTPQSGSHAGVDIVSSVGTPVYSTTKGIVIKKNECSDESSCEYFGNYVVIATNFDGKLIANFYAHLNGIQEGIETGKIVKKGDKIGFIGNSGKTTAPHLHLQINKLGKAEEIESINLAKKLFKGWFNDQKKIMEKTYNPISFIEKHFLTTDDSFQYTPLAENEGDSDIIQEEGTNGENETTGKEEKTDGEEESTGEHESPEKENFKIGKIETSKTNDKLTLGDTIDMQIYTTGENGMITLTNNNSVLEPSQDIIKPDGSGKHKVTIKAKNTGQGEIIVSDGENKENKFFKVYKQQRKIYGLKIKGPEKIYTTSEQKFVIYPLDKFGSQISKSLKGEINISIKNKDTGEKHELKTIKAEGDSSSVKFKLKAPSATKHKITVEFDGDNSSMMAQKTLEGEVFIDYSKTEKYGKSFKYLNEKGIIQGHEGLLMPEKGITRAEITTVLMRKKYGENKESFRKKMENYIEKNGKFFKDIDGTEWHAPYLYMAFRDKVLKGANGKALPEKVATKAELITIYGRYFDVSKYEVFTNWLDVEEDDRFKIYADAAKNYNLYPFSNTKYFNPKEKVNRLKAFESLYRYIQHSPEKISKAPEKNQPEEKNAAAPAKEKTEDKEIESVIKTLMEEEQ